LVGIQFRRVELAGISIGVGQWAAASRLERLAGETLVKDARIEVEHDAELGLLPSQLSRGGLGQSGGAGGDRGTGPFSSEETRGERETKRQTEEQTNKTAGTEEL
jgi:hypothetical protein